MIHHIENNQITSEVLQNEKLVIIDFFATWCMPCQMLAPVYDKISRKYGESAEFYKVNIDENQDTSIRFNVQSVPTILFFKDGEQIEKKVGYMDENEFSEIIESLI